jgi:hypothetical protein
VNGFIGEALDEATDLKNEMLTIGNIVDIRGSGLKIASDEEHASEVGFFFTSEATGDIQATIIPVNEPKLLKILVPPLPATEYTILGKKQRRAPEGCARDKIGFYGNTGLKTAVLKYKSLSVYYVCRQVFCTDMCRGRPKSSFYHCSLEK